MRSDLSAVHRIDEMESVPGPRAFALVHRLSAYQSVIRALMRAQLAKREPAAVGPQEMKATDWLAKRPTLTDKIATVPYRLNQKG